MDWLFGFFTGILFAWWFWPLCLIVALFCEAAERSIGAVFAALLATVGFYGFFNVGEWSWYWLGITFVSYVAAGIAYSVWRWYRYVDRRAEAFNEKLPSLKTDASNSNTGEARLENAVQQFNNETDYRQQLDKITYWVFMWPLNGLAHLFGDIIRLTEKIITTFFSGLFDSITNRAKGKIDIDFDDPLGKNTEGAANV